METKKDLIEMAIANFEHIAQIGDRLTSGNASHQVATIKGIAVRMAEYLREYRADAENQTRADGFQQGIAAADEFISDGTLPADGELVLVRSDKGIIATGKVVDEFKVWEIYTPYSREYFGDVVGWRPIFHNPQK